MTREEFARRWLGAPIAPPPEARSVHPAARTELSPRLFKERPPRASKLALAGQQLKRTGLMAGGALGLFAVMALVVVKLGPYVAEYAATYLTY
nr:hypothetical protein [uncultured Brevundimonas sp.]